MCGVVVWVCVCVLRVCGCLLKFFFGKRGTGDFLENVGHPSDAGRTTDTNDGGNGKDQRMKPTRKCLAWKIGPPKFRNRIVLEDRNDRVLVFTFEAKK